MALPIPKMRTRLDLKVSPLRLVDDPMRHEGHRQAGSGSTYTNFLTGPFRNERLALEPTDDRVVAERRP
jgi:hypothetical protein